MSLLKIEKLCACIDDREILHNISLELKPSETCVLVGANGAGKSTIMQSIIGNEKYHVAASQAIFNGEDISQKSIDERSRAGIFLSFQEPVGISGLKLSELLRSALEARGERLNLRDFQMRIAKAAEQLDLNPLITQRDLASGFSGGEKKKLEILQMLVLRPKLVMLDEIDSGLDIDASRNISSILDNYQKETGASYIIISHNFRVLESLKINQALLIEGGAIAERGDSSLIERIKKRGFKK